MGQPESENKQYMEQAGYNAIGTVKIGEATMYMRPIDGKVVYEVSGMLFVRTDLPEAMNGEGILIIRDCVGAKVLSVKAQCTNCREEIDLENNVGHERGCPMENETCDICGMDGIVIKTHSSMCPKAGYGWSWDVKAQPAPLKDIVDLQDTLQSLYQKTEETLGHSIEESLEVCDDCKFVVNPIDNSGHGKYCPAFTAPNPIGSHWHPIEEIKGDTDGSDNNNDAVRIGGDGD